MAMGLGKTSTVLSAVNTLFEDWRTKGVLVVAPLRVCVLTWPNEVAKWDEFSWFKVANLRTKKGWQMLEAGAAHLYLLNWDQLPLLCDGYLHGKSSSQLAFDTVVLDEATRAKNPDSKRVNLFRSHTHKFKRIWELTGTPAPNSLLELYAQIRLLDEGARLGKTFAAYRDAHFDQADRFGYSYKIREGSAEKIHQLVSDIALVLRAEDWLNIPTTAVEDVEVPLPTSAKRLYEELADELMAITDKGEEVIALNAGVLVNKLLQVTGGAVYLQQEWDENQKPLPKDVAVLHDAKLKALQKLDKEIGSEPALVACHYQHEQSRIHAALPGSVRFDSCRSESTIRQLEIAWNAGRVKRLIADPRSIGHGLNLQDGGRNIIWFSNQHSRELYDQMNGRLARKGQTLVPRVFRINCPGTIDDAVLATLEEKGQGQSALLQAVMNFRKLRMAA